MRAARLSGEDCLQSVGFTTKLLCAVKTGPYKLGRVINVHCQSGYRTGYPNSRLLKVGECLMPSVKVRDNEPFDVALRRFKRSCEKAGVLSEVRRRENYEKPTAERKRKAAAAVKRHAKKLQRERKRFERLY